MPENLFKPDCVRTYSGVYINLVKPDPLCIFPVDIAVGLGRECRFGNHTKKVYSVAEHSIYCMELAEAMHPGKKALPFKVLLHDAHEYILRDLPTPMKDLLPEYKKYAELLQDAIHERFGVRISHEEQEIIKTVDKLALQWEWQNKKLRWTGLLLDEKSRVHLFIHYFERLCKVPFVMHP